MRCSGEACLIAISDSEIALMTPVIATGTVVTGSRTDLLAPFLCISYGLVSPAGRALPELG